MKIEAFEEMKSRIGYIAIYSVSVMLDKARDPELCDVWNIRKVARKTGIKMTDFNRTRTYMEIVSMY